MVITSATVPAPELQKVSFRSEDVPIKAVTVFCENKAEVTRIVNFSSPSSLGSHEVELKELPGRFLIDEASVRVKGSGHCTILHVGFSDEGAETKPELTDEEKEKAKVEKERIKREIQRLSDELTVLTQQSSRHQRMREFADRFAERAVTATARGSANAAAALGVSDGPAPSAGDVGKALDWWAAKAMETDGEIHRLELEGRRLKDAIAEIRKCPSASAAVEEERRKAAKKPQGRILVSIDVLELGPIELEVKYMIRGATWSPAYDLRVETQTDSISCTYFGRVTQTTTEDWEGVDLKLSTAEPTVHGKPPALGTKTVSLKKAPPVPIMPGRRMSKKMSMPKSRRSSSLSVEEESEEDDFACEIMSSSDCMDMRTGHGGGPGFGGGVGGGGFVGGAPSAPPPPPAAKPAVAQVEGGGGGIGAVSFVIDKPAVIKSNGQTKKMTVGVLQLSAEVTHYVVPAKEPAAYLQAKATNNTDYLLLASEDVSIFFDNSFVTKTSLTSVSPGESFQTFLGIDPAVKITVAAPRKTSKKRGIFSKSHHVTHTHSTSISNKKMVPVTCVVVDAIPLSTNEIIKVTLKQPAATSISELEAITDDVLASAALEMFGGGVGRGQGDGRSHSSSSSSITQPLPPSPPSNPTITRVAGVAKSPSNHLAWVGEIAPQGEVSIPLTYVVEWPTGKDIEVFD